MIDEKLSKAFTELVDKVEATESRKRRDGREKEEMLPLHVLKEQGLIPALDRTLESFVHMLFVVDRLNHMGHGGEDKARKAHKILKELLSEIHSQMPEKIAGSMIERYAGFVKEKMTPQHIPNNDDFEGLARRVLAILPDINDLVHSGRGDYERLNTKMYRTIVELAADIRNLKG